VISTAVVDLETTDLSGDRGIILCGCIKSSEQSGIITIRSDETNPRWDEGRRGDDRATTRQLARILASHDVIVAHNGGNFDIPFLRTRMLRWHLPRLPDLKLIDPCLIAFRKFRLRNNSLATILDHLGLKDRKTPLDFAVWADAMHNGSRKAMDKIVNHCIQDVKALDGVLQMVKPYVKVLDDRGSAL
jgi:uncharacterized protein YprB with RNaseH-like and TPR domain